MSAFREGGSDRFVELCGLAFQGLEEGWVTTLVKVGRNPSPETEADPTERRCRLFCQKFLSA